MKIKVAPDLCCGAGLCAKVAGEVYRLDASGYNASDGAEVAPGQEALARRGARACPERAITLEGDVESL